MPFVCTDSIKIPNNINLADSSYHASKEIDLLLGADCFWELLLEGKLRLPSGPYLQNTKLGWIISGPVNNINNVRINHIKCNFSQTLIDFNLDDQLKRFWEIEEVTKPSTYFTPDEKFCEDLFIKTTTRINGRFAVRMPLKEPAASLGKSYEVAMSRLLTLERKLNRSPLERDMYNEFMKEYLSLGHMSQLHNFDQNTPHYFLPHMGVFREQSLTTKLRVVFDASQKTSSSKSLNDIQFPGPALQNDLVGILLRFRQFRYAGCADIEKFFRQILIQSDQRNLQLILWREKPTEPVSVFRLNTITYGQASSPYLSIRCLRQLGIDCNEEEVSRTILEDFFVDDLILSNDSKENLAYICKRVTDICKSASFPLRKWIFNASDIAPQIMSNCDDSTRHLSLDENYSCKTLGLGWFSNTDQFHFISKLNKDLGKVTKRLILSVVSQIYDPLGLLSPVVITTKITLQKLWLSKVGWDDALPQPIVNKWKEFLNSLDNLHAIRIPRHAVGLNAIRTELHLFTDASEAAYGACAYIRTYDCVGNVAMHLLIAKSRVAPIKPVSIPRLELCGALTGARLLAKIKTCLRMEFHKIIFWIDSTIVLSWLKMSPNLLKTFVQNRVVEINELAGNATFLHISGKHNPADLLSRGSTLDELANCKLWWQGPEMLHDVNVSYVTENVSYEVDLPELKNLKINLSTQVSTLDCVLDFNRFSSFKRMQRSFAFVLRFINNLKLKRRENRLLGELTLEELDASLYSMIRLVQKQSFSDEYFALLNKHTLKTSSHIRTLNVFLDKHNIIRVGGRLENSLQLTYDKKHTVLINSNHYYTYILFRHEHLNLMHAGPQLLLANIRDRWWPLGGRNLARKVVRECVKCRRNTGKTLQPIMGSLPVERLNPGFPFMYSGVDYAGPLYILNKKGRGAKLEKAYLCLFICLTTKALHLELVTSM